MIVNQIILCVMAFFLILGALDKCFSNRFKLGEKFDEGIFATSGLIVPMVGFICAAPVIGAILSPIVSPLFTLIGADPSMFSGLILSSDMGGYPLAMYMAENKAIGEFSGVIVGAVIGGAICFAIPILLNNVREVDRKSTATGLMLGIVAMPFGCLAGGLTAGLDFYLLLINLVPIILLAVILIIGLSLFQQKTILLFILFSRVVLAFATIMFAIAGVEEMTSVHLIGGMAPLSEGFIIVGSICVVLAGAYPFVSVLTRILNKPLQSMSSILGINTISCAAFLAVLPNFLPVMPMIKDMGNRGRIIVMAFLINAGSVLGDYMGFTASVANHLIIPMIVAKFVGAFVAVFFAMLFCKKMGITDKDEPKPVLVKIADYK